MAFPYRVCDDPPLYPPAVCSKHSQRCLPLPEPFCPGTQQGSGHGVQATLIVGPWLFNIGDGGLTHSAPGYKSVTTEAVRGSYCCELLVFVSVCILIFID